ncbi:MAG: TRAP transporter fused permease subunit [Rhodospirillaceae bacterium]|jgi:TRAP transporter 4TM/12TM fusion protein|nr:TRAP transporter fused permease subunit [Rhodospirillaceae bacterium]MBT5457473.1 TRAP transporter fused permease subunit [Rhodospirillaceae bacterium]
MATNPADISAAHSEGDSQLTLTGPWIHIVSWLGGFLALIPIFFASEIHLTLGLQIFTEQGMALALGLGLAIVFIKSPFNPKTKKTTVPFYDAFLALLGLAAGAYLAWRFPILQDELFERRPEASTIGTILIPLIVEAIRRTAGWSLTSIVLFFLAYTAFGHHIPGVFQATEATYVVFTARIVADSVAVLGLPLTIVVVVVLPFVFFGQLLMKGGASEWFTNISTALIGRSRGGSAKIAVVASGLFGAISGTAVSNVASTGLITIPLMKRGGYDPRTAAAFEAVASTGGQIMPPIMGAAAFLMAEILEIGYTEVVLAAIIPALLYYVAVFVYADLEAAKKNIQPVPEELIPPLGKTLKEGWFFVVPFAVLIYALFVMNRAPETAALWSGATVVIVNWIFGYKKTRITVPQIITAVRDTGVRGGSEIVIIGAMAGLIIGILGATGLGEALTQALVTVGEGNLALLLGITAIICIVLGMGMPTTAIYLLVSIIAAPPLIKLGINPLAAHMYVFYFGIVSLITPPVAIAAFVAANLAGSSPMATAVTAVRLGWTALVVPVMFVLSPNLIMQGEPVDIIIAFVTAVAGVWVTTCGIQGYFVRPLNFLLRIGFMVGGILLLIPVEAFPNAIYTELAGIALTLLLVGREMLARRKLEAA